MKTKELLRKLESPEGEVKIPLTDWVEVKNHLATLDKELSKEKDLTEMYRRGIMRFLEGVYGHTSLDTRVLLAEQILTCARDKVGFETRYGGMTDQLSIRVLKRE